MKTSIVYATIKCVVQHEDDQDPDDVLAEANYEIAIEPDAGKQTPMILHTEMTDSENRGECHPTEFYMLEERHREELLEERRRDEKRGLDPQHEDPSN